MVRNLTRRRFLTASSAVGVGVAGAAALAACGETKVVEKIVTQTVEVEVEKIVTKEVQITVERVVTAAMAAPQSKTVEFEFISDHVSGCARQVHYLGAGELPAGTARHQDQVHPAEWRL